MVKKLFTLMLLVGAFLTGHAQTGLSPEKGDKEVSLNLGAGTSVGIAAPLPNLGTYQVATPSGNWLDRGLSMNVEFRWMFARRWALKAKGGLSYGFAPAYGAVPGTAADDAATVGPEDVPNYAFVPESSRLQYLLALGFDRYVPLKYERLSFYYGLEAGFAYGRNLANADDESYNGKSVGEAFSFKGSFVTGFRYAVSEGLFLALEINPVGYAYQVNHLRPQAGLHLLSSNSHQFNFLASPTLKIGFRF